MLEKLTILQVTTQLALNEEKNYTEPETRDIKVKWNKFKDSIKKVSEEVLQTKVSGR